MLFEHIRIARGTRRVHSRDAVVYLRRILTVIGIDRPIVDHHFWRYSAAFLIWLGTFAMALGFMLSWIFDMHKFTLKQVLAALPVGIDCMGIIVKMAIMAVLHGRLQDVESFMDKLDARCTQPDEQADIRRLAAFGNRVLFVVFVLYVNYLFASFVVQLLDGYPLFALYNPVWDWRDGQWQLVLQAIGELVVTNCACFAIVTADTYPVIYIRVISSHLRILARRIRRLQQQQTIAVVHQPTKRTDKLVECILDHKHILAIFETIKPIISGTIFVQFMLSGCVLGVLMLNILLFPEVSSLVASVMLLVDVLVQILPTCYFANILHEDCDDLARAIFHSNWFEEDCRYQRVALIFMQHTQKPLKLIALNMIPITIASNINMIKFAFSVFTLMRNLDFGRFMRK